MDPYDFSLIAIVADSCSFPDADVCYKEFRIESVLCENLLE